MNSRAMSLQRLSVLLVFASVFGLGPLAVVNAQDVNSPTQTVESQPPQKELIGPNLEPFAGAYKEISQIHTTYKERIIQADDPTKSEALQEEANREDESGRHGSWTDHHGLQYNFSINSK